MSNSVQNNLKKRKIRWAIPAVSGILLVLFAQFFISSITEEQEDQQHQENFNRQYGIYSLNLPAELDFAGEKVPVHLQDVREKLDREMLVNTYWQSQTLLFFKRANKWFPVIEPILAKNNIPEDFKYLALIESGLMNVVSPAKATGFWQLLKGTAEGYGLEVNKEVDERYHVEKSTEAACKYLKGAKEKFGNWTLAAASYNMGKAGLLRRLKKQKVQNYYDLLLNRETSRYVFRILAVREILENPGKYGFHFRTKDLYEPYETYTVQVDTAVKNFTDFATRHGINYKVLKALNPWLRQSYLTNKSKKTYHIKLPKEELKQRLMYSDAPANPTVDQLINPAPDTTKTEK